MKFLHGQPKTRREFLASGAIGFLGVSAAPSLLACMLKSEAVRAAETATDAVPSLVIDLAGGAGLPGNFLVGKEGGPKDLLRSYDTLGWDPRAANAIDEQFGLPMARQASQMLAGILATASAGARANLRMASVCHFGQDDSSSNTLSPITLLANATGAGKIIGSATSLLGTPSGGNSQPIQPSPKFAPMRVSRLEDLISALELSGELGKLNPATTAVFRKLLTRLSESQLRRLGEMPIVQSMKLLKDDFHKAIGSPGGGDRLDPRKNGGIAPVYGLQANTPTNNPAAIQAGIVMNALLGQTGPGVLTLGGYDYHDSTSTTGDRKDREAGEVVGRAVEAAFRLKKPLFFQILTDGGVSANPGSRAWVSDSGIRSMTVMGYFDPNGAPKQRKIQLGHYTDGQGAELKTLVGEDRAKVAYSVFANYLAVSGRLGEFEKYALRGIFTTAELESVVAYG